MINNMLKGVNLAARLHNEFIERVEADGGTRDASNENTVAIKRLTNALSHQPAPLDEKLHGA